MKIRKERSEEHRAKIALSNHLNPRVKKHTDEAKKKIGLAMKGKHHSLETIEKIRKSRLGSKNPAWKGGIAPERIKARNTPEAREWRKAVYMRDFYSCVLCGLRGGWNRELQRRIVLNADHIKPFAEYPNLRWVLENGRTLCIDCHKKTDTYGYRKTVYA